MQQNPMKPKQTVYTAVEVDEDCIFWTYVWKHATEGRDKRLADRQRTERRLHQLGAAAGIILSVILAAAVSAWLGLL